MERRAWKTPAKPAAGSVCPMLLLPAAKLKGIALPFGLGSERRTAVAAASSMGSPRLVPAYPETHAQ
jgi:hypothetical protein